MNKEWEINVSKMFMNIFGAFLAAYGAAFTNGMNQHNCIKAGFGAVIVIVVGFLQKREKGATP